MYLANTIYYSLMILFVIKPFVHTLHLTNNPVIEIDEVNIDDDDALSDVSDGNSTIEAIDEDIEIVGQDQAVPQLLPIPYSDQYHFIPIERAPRANVSIDNVDNYLRFQDHAATNYNFYLTTQIERLQVELRLFLEFITNHFLSRNTVLRNLSVRTQNELYQSVRNITYRFRTAELAATIQFPVADAFSGNMRNSDPIL